MVLGELESELLTYRTDFAAGQARCKFHTGLFEHGYRREGDPVHRASVTRASAPKLPSDGIGRPHPRRRLGEPVTTPTVVLFHDRYRRQPTSVLLTAALSLCDDVSQSLLLELRVAP